MPLPLAFPFGLLVGISLAWLSRAELARSEVPLVLARPFLVAVALALFVHAPVLTYFVALHGDWAYLYLVRFARVPSAVDLVLVVLAAGQVPLGFALASPWAIAKRGSPVLRAAGVVGAILLVACIASAPRLSVSASFAQFRGGFGVAPLGRTPLGRGVLLSWVALLAGYGWSLRVLRSPRPPT
jgi:hypothetical protein